MNAIKIELDNMNIVNTIVNLFIDVVRTEIGRLNGLVLVMQQKYLVFVKCF